MSSLAAQLQSIASLDASRLTSRTGAPAGKSYLFPPKVAAEHDLDAIFSLGVGGFEELLQIDPGMSEFEDDLFSERAKRTDRMMLSQEENRELDQALERCLRRLGKWVGTMAGGKCIEWLVRRFRVHEMNTEVLIQIFLPYHESPNFPRMLAIVTIPTTSVYHAPFYPLINNAQPLPRSYITTAISPAKERTLRLLNDVVNLVPKAIEEKTVHRALLAFWSATMVELLEKSRSGKGLTEGLVKVLVEAFVNTLSTPEAGPEVSAAVYPPLVLLTRSIRLADEPFLAILTALLTPSSGSNPSQRLLTLLVILNDRSGWDQGLGEEGSERLAGIKRLGETVVAAMEKYGFEEAVRAILPVLVERADINLKHLQVIAEYQQLPASLVKLFASTLLTVASNPSVSDQNLGGIKTLLSILRERHSTIVDSAYLDVSSRLAVPVDLLNKSSDSGALVSIYSADISARVQGIKDLFSGLSLEDSDRETAKDAIRARLADQDPAVLDAIYEQNETLSELLTPEEVVDALRPVFVNSQVKAAVLSRHVKFLCGSLVALQPELEDRVFQQLLFHVMLPSSERRGLSRADWESIAAVPAKGSGILRRVAQEIAKAETGALDKETAPEVYRIIADSLSRSVAASANLQSHVSFLLDQLSSTLVSSRLLAHVVLAQMVQTLQGEQQMKLANQLLPVLSARLRIAPVRDVEDASEPLAVSFLRSVWIKPSSPRTASRVTIALVASLGKIVRVLGNAVDWMKERSSSPSNDASFGTFSTDLYALVNSNYLPPTLSRVLLRSLLTQLNEDALPFLASVYASPSLSSALRIAALRHATAFVSAHASAEEGKAVDFQMVLPSLLVAMQDSNQDVREAGLGVLKAVGGLIRIGTGEIFALDTFYGSQSQHVQLLKPVDLRRYVDALLAVKNEIVLDPSRIAAVHSTQLGVAHSKGRKDSQNRRAIISALLSHALAWRSLPARRSILLSLVGVHDSAIFRGVLPLLVPLANSSSQEALWLQSKSEGEREEYLRLLWSVLEKGSASVLADPNGEAWKFLLGLLSPPGGESFPLGLRLRLLSLERMVDGSFDALAPTLKATYVCTLVKSLHDLPSDDIFATKPLLARLSLDTLPLIEVLQDLSAPLDSPAPRKKQKHDDNSAESDKLDRSVADLTILIESKDWKVIPGDAELVATLMTVLSALLGKRQAVHQGVDYAEQELLGAILAVVEKIQDSAEIKKAHVGIEVIIKVIRASTNPRTSQRALLVASELARLIPEGVLHNVMPIFTFMGASDFQRDDAYSFGVVEKTVERIVPVMTRSLKDKSTDELGLYKESAGFLGIFTDMVGRLPKHRTLPFFVHLVKSLGAKEFLPAVVMLLVDRATTRAGRNSGAAQAIEMALGVAGAFEVPVRLETVRQVVQEIARLFDDLSTDDKRAFLSQMLSENDDSDRTLRQITALLHLSIGLSRQLTGRPCDQDAVKDVVRQLIGLAAISSGAAMRGSDIPKTVQAALGGAMGLLSAENFLGVTNDVVADQDEQNAVMALNTLVARLPLIKKDVRTKSSNTISEIVKRSATLLGASVATVRAALAAIRAVASSALSGEDTALASIVGKLVQCASKAEEGGVILEILEIIGLTSRHLGSRIIPVIQSIVDLTLHLASLPTSSPPITKQALLTLTSVIETVPTFISSKQLSSILRHAIALRARDEQGSNSVLSVVAKRIGTKALLPVVMDLFATAQKGDATEMEAYFHLVRLALRNADRATIPGLIKPVFAFFLDVFDLRHRLQKQAMDADVVNRIEDSAIGSFLELVTKLNEGTFKPLFIRLYDWAVIDLSEGKSIADPRLIERKTVLLHVMSGLLNKFRHLLSPYIGTMMPHIEELLDAYANGDIEDVGLWTLLMGVLAKSFEVDDGAYWNDGLLLKIIPRLTSQLSIFPDLVSSASSPLTTTLSSLSGSTTSESVLKLLNERLCMFTRDDSPRVRIAALKAMDAVWEKQAEEMIALVPETVSEFLAELLEDENGEVEGEARKVLARIEKMTGSLKEYLE